MHKEITDLKSTIQKMEEAMVALDVEDFQSQIRSVRELLSDIELNFGKAVSTAQNIVLSSKDNEKVMSRPYEIINTIEFMYKPTMKIDIYEGHYLEFFAEERTEQLMKAMAINQHNEFWKQHRTIHGNVYGSVPKELIKGEHADKLAQFGWHSVNVNILDFGKIVEDQRELVRYCKVTFSHYILLLEESTGAYLVLEYLV